MRLKKIKDVIITKTNNTNYLKVDYKAYGVYTGSYDGGGTDSILYWNIDAAREKCLEYVNDLNKDAERMLNFCLEKAKTDELTQYYKDKYHDLIEIKPNHWSNKHDTVKVIEYQII